jgi:hypothetical protein
MAGISVICPQCGKNVTVPPQSVPKAEQLYQFLKQKRTEAKSVPNPITGNPPAVPLDPSNLEETFGNIGENELSRWLDEFWTTVSTDGDFNGEYPESAVNGTVPDADIAATLVRYQQFIVLYKILLGVVFLVGIALGLFAHALYVRHEIAASTAKLAHTQKNVVIGNLYYLDVNGERLPDADAVVIFLPMDRLPPFKFASSGLRPADRLEGDNVQQIEEFGGRCLRTGADGSFEFPYQKDRRYFVLMISAHVERENSEIDLASLRTLKKYFRNPVELLDQFCFHYEELQTSQETINFPHTF